MQNDAFNNDLVSGLIKDFIKEKRAARFWKNIRFFIGLMVVLVLLFLIFTTANAPEISEGEGKDYISLVRLQGMIAPGENFSAETVVPILQQAFADDKAKGVIIDINSGGGTPVQASIIHDTIIELKKKYHKKVIVVGEDLLASGAYFVAVAADEIYVNPNTITGSIGVIMKGFGFPELIKKIGIERRVFTSGTNKDRLDPFLPQDPEDIAKIRQVIDEVHTNFNQIVLKDRKNKLKASTNQLFSGDFWPGSTALKLGLIDKLGNLNEAMRDEFHVSRYKDYSESDSMLKMLAGQMGSSLNMVLNDTQLRVLEKI